VSAGVQIPVEELVQGRSQTTFSVIESAAHGARTCRRRKGRQTPAESIALKLVQCIGLLDAPGQGRVVNISHYSPTRWKKSGGGGVGLAVERRAPRKRMNALQPSPWVDGGEEVRLARMFQGQRLAVSSHPAALAGCGEAFTACCGMRIGCWEEPPLASVGL
jgi:hypothetical protein